jgi:hypothetical protein
MRTRRVLDGLGPWVDGLESHYPGEINHDSAEAIRLAMGTVDLYAIPFGTFDDDNMVGASYFMQTLAIARTLQDVSYGAQGERMGFDLYPYTENQIEAVKRSIVQWEFIDELARQLDRDALDAADSRADAVAA